MDCIDNTLWTAEFGKMQANFYITLVLERFTDLLLLLNVGTVLSISGIRFTHTSLATFGELSLDQMYHPGGRFRNRD
jgi:hypothetical protein